MKNKDFESIKEILARYYPVEEFRKKHEAESSEEFSKWLNK